MLIIPNHHISCFKFLYKKWVVANSSFFNPVTYKTHKYSPPQIPNCRSQYTMPSPRRKAWRKSKMSPESLCVCFFSVSDLNFSEQNILRLELIFFGNGADHLAGHPRSDDTGGNVMGDDASRPDNRACPDGNAAADGGICTDPDVFLQRNRC